MNNVSPSTSETKLNQYGYKENNNPIYTDKYIDIKQLNGS